MHSPASPVPPTARRQLGTALALLAVAGAGRQAGAQGAVTLDAGVAGVRFGDSVSTTAGTVGPSLRFDAGLLSVTASGTLSQLRAGGGAGVAAGAAAWTSQGAGAGSLFTPARGPLRGEVLASAGGSAHQDRTRTGQWRTLGRAHVMGERRGLWAGGGGGRTWNGAAWRTVGLAEAGAWARLGAATLVAVATPTSVTGTDGTSARYTDAELSARWVAGRMELAGSAGARAGDAALVAAGDGRAWGSASAAVWLAGPFALVGSAGSYPVDFAQGFPGGRYASLALRVAARPQPRPAGHAASRAGSLALAGRTAGVTAFTVARTAAGGHRVRLRARGAAAVELAGDFSGWAAISLRPAGNGWWSAELTIPHGTHEIAVRVDGGAWGAPPGLVEIADEFGGSAGRLVVP